MNEKIFKSNLMGIGQERYFYKLKELSNDELFILKTYIEMDNRPLIRKLNHKWVALFNKIFNIKNQLNNKSISHPEMDKMIDVLICNFEEDLHTSIEHEGEYFLEKLYIKDLTFYKDDDKLMSFFFYICQQYYRTQNLQSKVVRATVMFKGIDFEALWPVLRHTSATSVAFSLFNDRKKFQLVLLENESKIPYVTGDQPVINTFAVDLKLEEAPQDLEFYYPLTPWLAMLLTSKEEYKTETIIRVDKKKVMKYNSYIFNQSGKQIYASNKKVLEGYI